MATVGLLVAGYSGFYLCRSNLSVAMPALIEELGARGVDPKAAKFWLGVIISAGTLGYALGKFAAGGLVDLFGGRRNYLLGMGGAVVCTLLFTLGGSIPVFSLTWFANRLIQSIGWPGMIKMVSRWFSHRRYGLIMGVVSLSFLFGDALARYFMGALFARGLDWRAIFWIDGAILAVLWLASAFFLRESPAERNLAEPETTPTNLFGHEGADPNPTSIRPLLATFVRSRPFWMVCALSLGMTLLRETFSAWTPTYFVEDLGLTKAVAARTSAYFPLLGGFSVIIAGVLGDRFGRIGRALVMLGGMMLCGLTLGILGAGDYRGRATEGVVLVTLVGFLLIGPYAYLAGAISLDLGGKRAGATASGLIDGVGYLGGVLSGVVTAHIQIRFGWSGVFYTLAAVAFLTSAAAAVFLADMLQPPVPGITPTETHAGDEPSSESWESLV